MFKLNVIVKSLIRLSIKWYSPKWPHLWHCYI